MKKHAIVEVSWLDSHGVTAMWEWQDDYDDELPIIKTVGYYIKQKNKVLYVAQSISQQQYGRILKIPAGCISKLREIN